MEQKIQQAAELFRQAGKIWFITGAGVSADSGMPTYRGVGGLYNGGLTEDDMPVEQALSASVMANRPDITWKYLWQIGESCSRAEPNGAHHTIAKLQNTKDVLVLTQNVDGLHGRAGSKNVIEIHGEAFSLHCSQCKQHYDAGELYNNKPVLPPRCSKCEGTIRPNVVLFDEMLPDKALRRLYKAMESHWDLLVIIGTSAGFPYIVQPALNALSQGVPVIEINPDATELSSQVDLHIDAGAEESLQAISSLLELG